MIINRIGAEFEYEGATYVIGASIVGTPESEYEGLYGRPLTILFWIWLSWRRK